MSQLTSLIQLPTLAGLVRRRVLVNYRVDPRVIERLLPAPFQPKLVDGWAMAGICLIRLEQLRPKGLPAILGVASENAAHRIAVTWQDTAGELRDGVYIPRRDTGALLNAVAGGRLFPGQPSFAHFRVRDTASTLDFRMETRDGAADLWLRARTADDLPSTSRFASLPEASAFFADGSLGYSATQDCTRLDGLRLRIRRWQIAPLDVEWVVSSYFSDRARFPQGSVEYDCTLVMRDIPHEWEPLPKLSVQRAGADAPAPIVGDGVGVSACVAQTACSPAVARSAAAGSPGLSLAPLH